MIPKLEPLSRTQNIVMSAKMNSNDVIEVGFQLNNINLPSNDICSFPKITFETDGVAEASSARLHWKNRTGVYDKTMQLEDKAKIVYNISKVECSDKNEFQLYITTTVGNETVEHYVANGIAYVYLN